MAKRSAPRRWSSPARLLPEARLTGAWDLAAPWTEVVGFGSSGCFGSDGNLGFGAVVAHRVGSGRFSPATRPRTVRVRASGRAAVSSENEATCPAPKHPVRQLLAGIGFLSPTTTAPGGVLCRDHHAHRIGGPTGDPSRALAAVSGRTPEMFSSRMPRRPATRHPLLVTATLHSNPKRLRNHR
jgi:hypothetical protein